MGLMYVHSFNQGMYIYHPIEANHYAGIRWQGDGIGAYGLCVH